MKRWLLLLAMSVCSFAQSGLPSVLAIRNARILPASGPVIAKGTVVVRNGLIEAVGENVAIPAEAWIVEGEGLSVYPGLIDALSTWGMPNPAPARGGAAAGAPAGPAAVEERRVQTLADGGPEGRPSNSSWVKAAEQLDPNDRTIAAARNQGYTTAIAFPRVNIFAGQGSAVNLAGDNARKMVIGDPVGQLLTFPARGFGGGFPGSLMGIISYIRQIYLDAGHYKAAKELYAQNARGLKRPDYDRALEGVMESPRILLPASRTVEIERMLRFGAELKQPFLLYGGTEAYRAADLLAAAKVPVLFSLKWPERGREADPDAKESLRVLETRDKAPSGPAVLAKAGVKFAFTSSGVDRPADLRKAVKKAVDAGLSPEEALKAMTLYPAQIFGLDDRLGSIETGKIANLTIVEGDLFDEKSKIKFVLIDGTKYEPAPEAAPANQEATR